MTELDIAATRAARNYSRRELAARVLWWLGQWLVRLSPRPCFGWRCFVLRCFGATVGAHVHIYPSTRVYFPWNLEVGDWSAVGEDVRVYNPGPVIIGRRVTVSHGAHLCAATHDYRRADFPLRKKPIRVGDQAWICADGFVGPGVTIGDGVVVGARAVVTADLAAWEIVAGNPARRIGRRTISPAPGTK